MPDRVFGRSLGSHGNDCGFGSQRSEKGRMRGRRERRWGEREWEMLENDEGNGARVLSMSGKREARSSCAKTAHNTTSELLKNDADLHTELGFKANKPNGPVLFKKKKKKPRPQRSS